MNTIVSIPVGRSSELPAGKGFEFLCGRRKGFTVEKIGQTNLGAGLKLGLYLRLGDRAEVGGVDQGEEQVLAVGQTNPLTISSPAVRLQILLPPLVQNRSVFLPAPFFFAGSGSNKKNRFLTLINKFLTTPHPPH